MTGYVLGFTLALATLSLIWGVVSFNLLIRDRNRVSQSWSDVDVQLLRRHDLVPRLAEMVKGYAGYERALLTSLAELRAQGTGTSSPAARTEVEKSVGSGVTKLVALVESYPDLKASENFRDLHSKLVETENQIQYARRYYNGAVNLFNNRIQKFPDMLIANTFGFKPAEFFDADEKATAAPQVALS
jgi:LemA protein